MNAIRKEIGKRIKSLRKELGLTQLEFGKRIGLKANTITSYETNVRIPSDSAVRSICREFHVNEKWLRTGEGEMSVKLPHSTELENYITQAIQLNDIFVKKMIKFIANYMQLDDKSKKIVRDFIQSLGPKE